MYCRKENYTQNIMGKKLFSDIAIIFDEAFAHFILERCWDSWVTAMENTIKPGKATTRPKYSLAKSNKKFKG